jgi:transposase
MPRYKITLELDERDRLEQLTRRGKIAAAKLIHARALLLCDQGEYNSEPFMVKDAAKALGVSTRTIEKLKKRFVEEGLDSAIERRPSTRKPNIRFDGEFDARIMQLACSECPQGSNRWTLRLLAEKAVELEIVDSVSTMTIQRSLKKTGYVLT